MELRLKNIDIPALVDAEDMELLKEYKWYADHRSNAGQKTAYVRGWRYDKELKKTVFVHLHRLIMNPPKGKIVDHMNGDGLDNRRSNLRIVTYGENQKNRALGTRRTGTLITDYYINARTGHRVYAPGRES